MNNPTSESLVAIIVSNRILNLYHEESKCAMSELLRRREDDGDIFEFEKNIDEQVLLIEETISKSIDNNGFLSLISAIGKIK